MPRNGKWKGKVKQVIRRSCSPSSTSNQSGNTNDRKRERTPTASETSHGDTTKKSRRIHTGKTPESVDSNNSTVTQVYDSELWIKSSRQDTRRSLFEDKIDENRFRERLKEVTRNDLNIYMEHGFEMVDSVLDLLAQFNNTNPEFEASVQMVDEGVKQLREGLKQAKDGCDKLKLAVSDL